MAYGLIYEDFAPTAGSAWAGDSNGFRQASLHSAGCRGLQALSWRGCRPRGRRTGGVCSRISAALSCDTVKTRFSGSGGAWRSPVRKFYGQALFSRQNLHAIRPTAPRWIALIETCTKHAKQGECGAARGLQERTCLRNAVATAMDARSCGSSRPDAKHSSSTAALVQYACTRKTRTAPPCSHAGQGRCALQ